MSKKTFYVLMAVLMVSIPGFSAQERVVTVQNSVRVGHDDNIYLQKKKEGSAYITDILTLTGKFHISGRTDALLYWQPEVRYRFDADPEAVSYQDFYASLNHAMSQRTFLTLSDRVRYQQKDGQSGGSVSTEDQNYFENDLKGAVDITVSEVSQVSVGAGYNLRRWDDSFYGSTRGNDYDRYNINGAFRRQLMQNRTIGSLSVNYVDHEFEGSRGGYEAVSFIGGVDQTFNPKLSGFGRVGATMSTVDSSTGSSDDSTSPYLDAGLTHKPSERTTIDGSVGYSLSYAQNSVYNAQDEFNVRLGVRHDLTAKINIAGSIAYILSQFDSAYSRFGIGDAEEDFVRINIRATYQLNRNNFIEAGYEFTDKSNDTAFLTEYDRNSFDIGWRLRL